MRSEGRPITAVVIALTILAGGCDFEQRSTPTTPSEIANSFVGILASASGPLATELPTPESCTGLEWHVTDQEGNTVAGDFKATCAGGIELTGTATGTIEGPSIAWSASGMATSSVTLPCAFSLTGTAQLEGSEIIQVDSSGTTCLGPISGTEALQKQ